MPSTFLKHSKSVFILSSLVFLVACTRPTGMPQGSGVDLKGDQDDVLSLKLNYYDENCINDFSDDILSLRDDYLEHMDAETGPVNEEDVPFTDSISSPSDCALAISRAKELNLAPELDPLAESFLGSLQAIYPLINASDKYYSREAYKDDDLLKGREMHPKLMLAFSDFEEVNAKFTEATQATRKSLNLRLRDKYKQEGLTYEYLVKDAFLKGQSMLMLGQVEDYKNLDLEAFNSAIEAYESSLNELENFVLQNPTYFESYIAERNSYLDSIDDFEVSSQDYLMEAKQLMRRKRDNIPYDGSDLKSLEGGNIEGSPQHLYRMYKDMVYDMTWLMIS